MQSKQGEEEGTNFRKEMDSIPRTRIQQDWCAEMRGKGARWIVVWS